MFLQRLIEILSAFGNRPIRLIFSEIKFVFDCIENIVELSVACCTSDSHCLSDHSAKRIVVVV